MNTKLMHLIVAAALALPLGANAIGNNEKGCLVGGAVGGVAGHAIGSGGNKNTLLGAAAGCAVGAVVNKQRVKKNDAAKRENQKVARASRQDVQPIR